MKHTWAGHLLLVCGVLAVVFVTARAAGDRVEQNQQSKRATQGERVEVRSFESLVAHLEAMPGLQASFVEEKRLALLSAPLKSEGVLYFSKPLMLRKEAQSPDSSVLVVNGATMRMAHGKTNEERRASQQTINLDNNPAARLFVSSFVSLLAADAQALQRVYSVAFEAHSPATDARSTKANSNSWTLRLTPKVSPLDKLIKQVEMHGTGVVVQSVHVTETQGDTTVTTILSPNPKRQFSSDEQKLLFDSVDVVTP